MLPHEIARAQAQDIALRLKNEQRALMIANYNWKKLQEYTYQNALPWTPPMEYTTLVNEQNALSKADEPRQRAICVDILRPIAGTMADNIVKELSDEEVNTLVAFKEDFIKEARLTIKHKIDASVFKGYLLRFINNRNYSVNHKSNVTIESDLLSMEPNQTSEQYLLSSNPEPVQSSNIQDFFDKLSPIDQEYFSQLSPEQQEALYKDLEDDFKNMPLGHSITLNKPSEWMKSWYARNTTENEKEKRETKEQIIKELIEIYGEASKHPVASQKFTEKIIAAKLDVTNRGRSIFNKNNKISLAKFDEYNLPELKYMRSIARETLKETNGNGLRRRKKNIIMGKGVSVDSKYYVDSEKLNKNILCIKYKSNANKKVNDVAINNDTKAIIKDILFNKFDASKYEKLSVDDKQKIILFIKAMNLDDLGIKDTELETFFNDYTIRLAEVQSGNDNKDLIKQLKKDTLKLMKLGRINRTEGYDILYYLSL